MGFIMRSGTALIALVGAAALYAVGALFLATAFMALTPSNQPMASDLTQTGYWLRFAGAAVALLAVCVAGRSPTSNSATGNSAIDISPASSRTTTNGTTGNSTTSNGATNSRAADNSTTGNSNRTTRNHPTGNRPTNSRPASNRTTSIRTTGNRAADNSSASSRVPDSTGSTAATDPATSPATDPTTRPSTSKHRRIGRRVLVSPLGEAPHERAGNGPYVQIRDHAAVDAVIVALGVLLVTIGLLVTAATGRTNQATGIVGAFGFVLLGLLLLWRSTGNTPELAAGLAALAFGIGYAMVATATSTQGQIIAGLLEAGGTATIAAAIVAARPREYLWTGAGRVPFLRPVVGGLLLLTVAFVTAAIAAGVVYSRNATVTDIRVGPAIAYALEGAGIAMFGWAAAWRVYLANRMQHAR